MVGTPSRLEDCHHVDVTIITYCGCFRGLYGRRGNVGRSSEEGDEGVEKKRRMQFKYDPKSYALDHGIVEGDAVFLYFSARYACP
ncbi:hypothetical protein CR513_57317, partial [Mucuna pruriens]